MKKLVRVPATTANLGPGFDTLGLALSIWNEVEVAVLGETGPMTISIEGFGERHLPEDHNNLILSSARYLLGANAAGMHFHSRNLFPGSSGLGSSSSAILLGLSGANAFLENPLSPQKILNLSNKLEGHPDNVTPALLGGLTLAALDGAEVLSRKVMPAAGWQVGVVVPMVSITTKAMRSALKEYVLLKDAVHNISRAVLVVQAFVEGDEGLLFSVIEDKLHQPYRMPLIPGASDALAAARDLGLPAALSGAGPGVVVFGMDNSAVREAIEAMKVCFARAGLAQWSWVGEPDLRGTQVFSI